MQQTYLFYDLETTGLNKCFDQIIQFAAIRTDLKLNEISRHEYQVRLNPDVIPDPEAILTHGCGIDQLLEGQNEFEVLQNIHGLINTPGTISIGYNTLSFDDEFLRFSFYRNLLAPYTHQYANQCSRMDLYPITLLFYLFKNEVIQWPPLMDGKTSLKLEKINEANQFVIGPSHQAMVDVEVTVALARKFLEFPDMWDYATKFFNKKLDLEKMTQLKEAILINGKLGAKNNYQTYSLLIGQHHHYKNQFLWLKLDDELLSTTTLETIPMSSTYVVRKKAAENILLLPPLPRFIERLTSERLQLIDSNKKWLNNNPGLFQEICNHHLNYQYPKIPNLDIDAALYEIGFPSAQEELLFAKFHQATASDKFKIAQLLTLMRQKQAMRIIGRHYIEHLSSEEKIKFQQYLSKTYGPDSKEEIVDFQGRIKRTAQSVKIQIEVLQNSGVLSENQQLLLERLKEYLEAKTVSQV